MRAVLGRIEWFWLGLFLFTVSFFLVAVGGPGVLSPPARGYHCAFYAFALPMSDLLGRNYISDAYQDSLLAFVSVLVSGWINIVFAAALIAFLSRRRKLGSALRWFVLAMVPFCWTSFWYEGLYPREGYLLWTAGMLLALFSARPRRVSGP